MHCHSRPVTLLLGLPVLLFSLCLLAQAPVEAQGVKPDENVKKDDKTEKKDTPKPDDPLEPVVWDRVTDDGVKIVGTFYPSPKGKNAPTIILLHALERSSAKRQDFETFPKLLQSKGAAVVTFDWRGYGDSTEVLPDRYWTPAYGRTRPSGFKANDPPTKISAKDWKRWPDLLWLGNDLTCVKKFVSSKNNAMECNGSNICLLGVEDGALMGYLWLTQEYTNPDRWKTPGTMTNPPKTEGDDITCCVWISMTPHLAPFNQPKKNLERYLRNWMEYPHRNTSERFHQANAAYFYYPVVKTFLLYGQNDKEAKAFWSKAIKWMKPEKDSESLKHTGEFIVKNTNLTGAKLLGNESFETDANIVKYLELYMPKGRPWQEQTDPDRLEPKLFPMQRLGIN